MRVNVDESDKSFSDVSKVLGLALAYTTSQYKDSRTHRVKSGEQKLWMGVLQQTMKDWENYKNDSQSHSKSKDARDILSWIESNDDSLTFIAEVVGDILDIDLDAKKLRRFVKRWMINHNIRTIK